ncbi:MAG: YraN family protein [Vicinamibacteria bacterium]
MAKKVRTVLEWARSLVLRPDLGARGESVAARELKRRGYEILERRWRCRIGEIDIVARDGETLVIVEVKARARADFGAPVNAVNREKRRRLERLARAYLKARRLQDVMVRFDAVGVTFLPDQSPRIEVYPNIGPF